MVTNRSGLNNDTMEELLETIIFSGDMVAFIKKSSDARSEDFCNFVRDRLSSSNDADEQDVLREISRITSSTNEHLETVNIGLIWPTVIPTELTDAYESEESSEVETDLASHLKAIQGGKDGEYVQIIDRLGALEKKNAAVKNLISSKTNQVSTLQGVVDEGERKAREVAAIMQKKQEEALAKAQAEAEAVSKNNREFKHF